MTARYGEFALEGYQFVAEAPSNSAEPREWHLVVTKDNEIVRDERLRMMWEPKFGYDTGDVNTLESRIEEIIVELGLTGSD